MAFARMLPPGDGRRPSITVNGRQYSCAIGSTLDVPDFDATVLEVNGWTRAAPGLVGPTSQRPATPYKGQAYLDTTLGFLVTWDGVAWRHHVTGAAS